MTKLIHTLRTTFHALRADFARIHLRENCHDYECSCRSGRPIRDAAGFIQQHLWAQPLRTWGENYRRRNGTRSLRGRFVFRLCVFLATPYYYTFHLTRTGDNIRLFFHDLRPSVRASHRATYYEQGAGFVEYRSFGGVTDSLETRMPNEY